MTPGLRIAYFSNFSPKKLGTGEGRIVAFAREARARGHDLTLFGREPIHPVVAEALREAGGRWRPLGELASRPFHAGRRLAREFDVIQLNMIAPRSTLAFCAYAAWPTKVLFVDRVSGPPDGDPRRSPPYRILDRITMARVHEVAGITSYVERRARNRFSLTRTRTIYNGVDCDRFHPPEARAAEGVLRIVVVASLIPEKGVAVLLDALAGLDDRPWSLEIVGEGPERSRLEETVRACGLEERVSFLGLRDDVPELMRRADVAVHPAVWQEALGNTVLEAMASGCALVASDTGGIPELLVHEEEGLLVPPSDAHALRAALRRLAADPALRHRLGERARARVERDFTLEASIREHLDWCEEAAGWRV